MFKILARVGDVNPFYTVVFLPVPLYILPAVKKQIIILSLVFLVVVGLWYYSSQKPMTPDLPRSFYSFSPDDVTAFQINNFTLGIYFQKKEGSWFLRRVINDLSAKLSKETGTMVTETDSRPIPADSSKVAEALTYLLYLRQLEPVSLGAGSPATFEINDYSLHVVFYGVDNRELDRIYIGKNGPDIDSSFIKRAGTTSVYLAPVDFRRLFLRQFTNWQIESKAENQ